MDLGGGAIVFSSVRSLTVVVVVMVAAGVLTTTPTGVPTRRLGLVRLVPHLLGLRLGLVVCRLLFGPPPFLLARTSLVGSLARRWGSPVALSPCFLAAGCTKGDYIHASLLERVFDAPLVLSKSVMVVQGRAWRELDTL
jgi:hypothetical protein